MKSNDPETFANMVGELEQMHTMSNTELIELLDKPLAEITFDPTLIATKLFDRGGLNELIARFPDSKLGIIELYNQYGRIKKLATKLLAAKQ